MELGSVSIACKQTGIETLRTATVTVLSAGDAADLDILYLYVLSLYQAMQCREGL